MPFEPTFLVTSWKNTGQAARSNRFTGGHDRSDLWKVGMISGYIPGQSLNFFFESEAEAAHFSKWQLYSPRQLLQATDPDRPYIVGDIIQFPFEFASPYGGAPMKFPVWMVQFSDAVGRNFIDWQFPNEADARRFSKGQPYRPQDMFGTTLAPDYSNEAALLGAAFAAQQAENALNALLQRRQGDSGSGGAGGGGGGGGGGGSGGPFDLPPDPSLANPGAPPGAIGHPGWTAPPLPGAPGTPVPIKPPPAPSPRPTPPPPNPFTDYKALAAAALAEEAKEENAGVQWAESVPNNQIGMASQQLQIGNAKGYVPPVTSYEQEILSYVAAGASEPVAYQVTAAQIAQAKNLLAELNSEIKTAIAFAAVHSLGTKGGVTPNNANMPAGTQFTYQVVNGGGSGWYCEGPTRFALHIVFGAVGTLGVSTSLLSKAGFIYYNAGGFSYPFNGFFTGVYVGLSVSGDVVPTVNFHSY